MQRASPARGRVTRDVIVIGGSAGAIEALSELLRGLPTDLPAAVFVVVHIGEASVLPAALKRRSVLPVEAARSGVRFERGRIYVGVPGVHLLLHDNHILLRRGPRENLSRPAIDALFRSAAASLGSRVIGVLLSGSLSDGTVGLRAIKRCGGMAIVQKPKKLRRRRCRATPYATSTSIMCGRSPRYRRCSRGWRASPRGLHRRCRSTSASRRRSRHRSGQT